MKYKKIFHGFDVLFCSIIVLTSIGFSIGFLNNANALFHDQASQQDGVIDDSKKIIESLFDRVNTASNNFQSEILSINDNETMMNTTQEYIDNLKEIILFAKKTTVQQDYKPVLNNYIDSIKNELESYVHYKEYLVTGNLTENKISMDLLSNAFNYETQAIKLYKQLESP